MSRSLIYTVSGAGPAVVSGGELPIGNVVRRFGCNVGVEGNGIRVRGRGYYKLLANYTFTPSVLGTYTIRAYANGEPIPGAVAETTTVTTTTLPVPGVFKLTEDEQEAIITFVVTAGVATNTVTPVSGAVIVEKA